jgi:hypothetical protein
VPLPRRFYQRGDAAAVRQVRVGAGVQEQPHRLQLAVFRRRNQCGGLKPIAQLP